MGYSNGIVTAPVSIDDVKKALGVSSNDLGTLCKATQINKWAKYKPFKSTLLGVPSEENRRNARFGLNIPILKSGGLFNKLAWDCVCGVVNTSNNLGGLWEYVKPYGGSTAPYRLPDFVDTRNQTDGYRSAASIPMRGISGGSTPGRRPSSFPNAGTVPRTLGALFSKSATGQRRGARSPCAS